MGISIIIPLYNKERHIIDTLKCVEAQTYNDYEVIIVNDGSTDSSLEIVKNYIELNKNRSNYILVEQTNQGASKARNNGVKYAQNQYIAFLDADDYWNKDYLQSMVDLIHKYPDAGAYGCNYIIEENGKASVLDFPGIDIDEGYIKNYFRSSKLYTPLWTSAIVIKKDVFLKLGGFSTDCKVCEDIDLWCRIAATQKIAYINRPLAKYIRDSMNMLSRSTDVSYSFPFLDNYNQLISPDSELYDSVEDYVIYKKLMAISFDLLISNNKNEAKILLKEVGFPKKYFIKAIFYRILYYSPHFITRLYCSLR